MINTTLTTNSRELYFCSQLDSYRHYLDDRWIHKCEECITNTRLDPAYTNLLFRWRSIAITATMPWIAATSAPSALNGFQESSKSDLIALQVVDNFGSFLFRDIPELFENAKLREKIRISIAKMTERAQIAKERTKSTITDDVFWQKYITEPQFVLGITNTQLQSFVGFYDAYEYFVASAIRIASGDVGYEIKNSEKAATLLCKLFGDTLTNLAWTNSDVIIAAKIRNDIVHNSGISRIKHHGIFSSDHFIHNGHYQVWPDDLRTLLSLLANGVDALISAFNTRESGRSG